MADMPIEGAYRTGIFSGGRNPDLGLFVDSTAEQIAYLSATQWGELGLPQDLVTQFLTSTECVVSTLVDTLGKKLVGYAIAIPTLTAFTGDTFPLIAQYFQEMAQAEKLSLDEPQMASLLVPNKHIAYYLEQLIDSAHRNQGQGSKLRSAVNSGALRNGFTSMQEHIVADAYGKHMVQKWEDDGVLLQRPIYFNHLPESMNPYMGKDGPGQYFVHYRLVSTPSR